MKLCGGIHPVSLTVSFQGVLQTSHIFQQRQFVEFFEPHHKSSFTFTMMVGLQALGWYLMAEPTDESCITTTYAQQTCWTHGKLTFS